MDSDKKTTYLTLFHPISGFISMSSLIFMKNILDGHGQQLKSLKSKKFRGLNHDTLAYTKLFPSVLVTFANLFNYLEVRANVT